MRLIGPAGEKLGIRPIKEALDRAREYELDLVEVAPNSNPPVCRILDYGKLKYELAKKDKAAKKKQHAFQLKEMRYRPKIDEHDYAFKTKHVREFIESGSKVRVYVMFRGREMAYTELGRKILDRVARDLEDISVIEMEPKIDRRNMSMVLAPRPEILKRVRTSTEQKTEPKQAEAKKELKEDQEQQEKTDDSVVTSE